MFLREQISCYLELVLYRTDDLQYTYLDRFHYVQNRQMVCYVELNRQMIKHFSVPDDLQFFGLCIHYASSIGQMTCPFDSRIDRFHCICRVDR
jgi:hypothetical protein